MYGASSRPQQRGGRGSHQLPMQSQRARRAASPELHFADIHFKQIMVEYGALALEEMRVRAVHSGMTHDSRSSFEGKLGGCTSRCGIARGEFAVDERRGLPRASRQQPAGIGSARRLVAGTVVCESRSAR